MINFAIVGCGFIAKKHYDALENVEGANLVALCDTDPSRMQPFFDLNPNLKLYTDYNELIKDPDVDVISICTPSGTHAELAILGANAKKHILVEKPIALEVKEAKEIIDACNKNGVKLSVVHPNRFRPVFKYLKSLKSENSFGKISHANATVRWNRNQEYYDQAPWRGTKKYDGGVLMNQAIHNLDILLWLMGDIDEVYSYNATRLRNIETEDVSVGVVKFKDGSLGVIEAATTIYPRNFEESISIFGEKGTIKVGGSNALYIEHAVFKDIDETILSQKKSELKTDPFGKPGHQCIIEDFIESIKYDKTPAITGEDGLKVLSLVKALEKSAEIGESVKL